MAEKKQKAQPQNAQQAPVPPVRAIQPAQSEPTEPSQAARPASEPQGGFFRDDSMDMPDNDPQNAELYEPDTEISWMASEFIHHDKSASWYLGLFAVAAAAGAGIFFLTHDIVSVAVILFAAFFLAYFGAHKPRQLEYKIDGQGITVGGKFYAFNDFRSFSLVPEGAFNSIVFMPLKRFAVPLSIYYDPRAETQIIDVLKNRLPFEPGRLDVSEKLMRKIRF